jgi:hypothetical protein
MHTKNHHYGTQSEAMFITIQTPEKNLVTSGQFNRHTGLKVFLNLPSAVQFEHS